MKPFLALLLTLFLALAGRADTGVADHATAQVTLSTTASVVIAANIDRRCVLIRNLDTSISIYVGKSGVTSATGFLVKAGETFVTNSKAAVYAVAASGTPAVSTFAEND